jgi:putative transposase
MEIKTGYRTLVLKYDVSRLPPEVASKIPGLLQVQEEFRRWANQWLKNPKTPRPAENPLKYFAVEFLHAGALKWLVGVKKSGVEARRIKPPLFFNAQLRLNGEKDMSRGVFVDLTEERIKIRRWSGRRGSTIVLPLSEGAVRWILERVREGGRLVLAAVWIGRSRRSHAVKLYVALVFRREVTAMQPKRLLVVDLNALHNGLTWVIVERERVLKKGVLRPDISKVLHLQKAATKLDSICAEEDGACGDAAATKSRIWRVLREWEDRAARELIWMARKRKTAIVVDIPNDETMRKLKEGNYASERKVFLNFGRIRRRLQDLSGWYGVPYREERLYSSVCPRCGRKMEELPNRRVKCQCGFEAHRDEVPALWAVKRFPELISFSSSSALQHPGLQDAGQRGGRDLHRDAVSQGTGGGVLRLRPLQSAEAAETRRFASPL